MIKDCFDLLIIILIVIILITIYNNMKKNGTVNKNRFQKIEYIG